MCVLGCLISFTQKENSCQLLELEWDMTQASTDSDMPNAAVLGTPISRYLDTCGSSRKNLGQLRATVTSVVRYCIGAHGLPEALWGSRCWLQTSLQMEVSVEWMVFSGPPLHTLHTNDYWKKWEASFKDAQRASRSSSGEAIAFALPEHTANPPPSTTWSSIGHNNDINIYI